jgi:hypothetical protein
MKYNKYAVLAAKNEGGIIIKRGMKVIVSTMLMCVMLSGIMGVSVCAAGTQGTGQSWTGSADLFEYN